MNDTEQKMLEQIEGWTWLHNSRKWHYFRAKESLCSMFMLMVHPREGYALSNDTSKDNCVACKRIRLAEIARAQGAGKS